MRAILAAMSGIGDQIAWRILAMAGVVLRFADRLFLTLCSLNLRSLVLLGILAAVPTGVGLFTFVYAEGLSYMSNDAKVCVNCHIMRDEYHAWQKGSHHQAAVCVDCHLPHPFPSKMLAKSTNGLRHSKAFTLQNFHEPIQITPKDSEILEENCIRCHESVVREMLQRGPDPGQSQACVRCHLQVGHGVMH